MNKPLLDELNSVWSHSEHRDPNRKKEIAYMCGGEGVRGLGHFGFNPWHL